jgi:hypothetical protein
MMSHGDCSRHVIDCGLSACHLAVNEAAHVVGLTVVGVRQMQVRVLGTIEMHIGCPRSLGGPTQRRAPAMLVQDANAVISVDRLAEADTGRQHGRPVVANTFTVRRSASGAVLTTEHGENGSIWHVDTSTWPALRASWPAGPDVGGVGRVRPGHGRP